MTYGVMAEREAELYRLGLSPEPQRAAIVEVGVAPAGMLPDEAPVTDFVSGDVLVDWLCAAPVDCMSDRACMRLSRGLRHTEWVVEAEQFLRTMTPLDARYVVDESYPDYTRAIDVRALVEGREQAHVLLLGGLRNDRERLVRLSHGAVGEGVAAQVLINGVSIAHGGYVRLAPGLHALVVEGSSGQTLYGWQWPERRLAPRFDEVTADDIEAVYHWRHARWQRSLDMAQTDETDAVAGVTLDPASLVGAEGYIRVGRSTAGLHWLVAPDGTPFYCRAMCSVNNSHGVGGRRKGVPAASGERVSHWLATMKHWGFNGLGSWTTPEFFDKGMAFTEIIEAYYEGPYLQDGPYRHGVIPDVFDPEWAHRLSRKCETLCAPLARSRELLGYFIDNERNFLDTRVPDGVTGPVYRVTDAVEKRRTIVAAEPIENAERLGLLQLVLSVDANRPAAKRAWAFLVERHGDDLQALATAWEVEIPSRLAINEMTVNGERLISPGYLADEQAFLKLWIEQYFKVAVGAIKRHDPNHLILGLRWAGIPSALVLAEEVKWCDIISLNHYRARMVEVLDPVFQGIQKPILIGECEPTNDSFKWVHDPIEPPGGYESDDDRLASRLYECMDRVFAHPGIVGYTFYAWKFNTLHPDRMQPVIQANRRAVCVHAAADRASGGAGACAPLHGQIYVTLLMHGRQTLELGMVCRDGEWDPLVTGNALRGSLTAAAAPDGAVMLHLDVSVRVGMFAGTQGALQASVTLRRTGAETLEGTFEGQWDGTPCRGEAKAYVHRRHPSRLV